MAKEKDSNGKPKLKKKRYEKELRTLQAELCHLQDWVKLEGIASSSSLKDVTAPARAAPSGPSQSVSARVFRIVALPAPSDREKTQL